MLGKIEGKMRRGWQRVRWLDSITNKIGMAIHSSILAWRIFRDREAWRATVHGVAKGQT